MNVILFYFNFKLTVLQNLISYNEKFYTRYLYAYKHVKYKQQYVNYFNKVCVSIILSIVSTFLHLEQLLFIFNILYVRWNY
jgi:hypothetical protein